MVNDYFHANVITLKHFIPQTYVMQLLLEYLPRFEGNMKQESP